jgi:hypothetical protein
MGNLKKQLERFIFLTNLSLLVGVPIFLGFSCFVLSLNISPEGYKNEIIQIVLVSMGFFFCGCAFIPLIIRKEAPFIFWLVRGLYAVILGTLMVIISWGLALVPIIGKFVFHR